MKKKFDLGSLLTTIVIVGVLLSVFSSSFPVGEIFGSMELMDLETLLDELNLILGFVVLGLVFIFWIWRATRDEKEFFWEFDKDQDQEDEN